MTVLLYSPPISLNPRNALDSVGQQLGALLFGSLTRLDSDFRVQGDLSESWSRSPDGKTYTFRMREGLSDHEGEAITAARMARCLENYRRGAKAPSRHVSAFPAWKTTEARGRDVRIVLDRPDPYLAKNILLLRYFRARGDLAEPCRETGPDEPLVTSGFMKPSRWETSPEDELALEPVRAPAERPMRFVFVQDDNSRASKILRGDVDAVLNGLSLPRTRWVQERLADRFKLLEREASTISYLAFNVRDPLLANREVRRAIAMAIDRESWVKKKMFGFGRVAPSLLHPSLPESHAVEFAYDPGRAERILDEQGYPRGRNGIRFALRQKTTSFRESLEQALFFQHSLKRIGIELNLDVVEPAVWAESVKRGAYQLSAGRFVGVSDGSIFYSVLRTGQNLNRSGYSNPELDRVLDLAVSEPDDARRKELLKRAQLTLAEDLPYLPLYYWSNGLILRKDLGGVTGPELSLSGALDPLLKIR